ncbi:MAG: glutaredoxin 3 [Proteobacteria bacterium]|nr:glutaredoxin 3 [Pseudomonadota bacterium]
MKRVEIYTTPICGYCARAKRLLSKKGVSYAEINIMIRPAKRAQMMQRTNGRSSVPQIFVGGKHIGGCDELHALERNGKLDAMLAA